MGEISIIPIGGINRLKKSKYGSQIFAKNLPTAELYAAGIQDISIYTISAIE